MPDVRESEWDREKRLRRERERMAPRRAFVDDDEITIGRARIEPEPSAPSIEDRTLDMIGRARPGRVAPDASTTRRAEIALATGPGGGIPEAWVRDTGGETQAQADTRVAAARRRREQQAAYERSRDAAYDESLLEGMQADNRVNAVGEGVVQGLTLGFADELGGAARAAFGPRAPGRDRSFGERYENERDALRRNAAHAQQEAPGAYGTAEFVGGIVPAMAIPGAGPGASLTRRVVTSAAGNALYGGLSGAGHSEEEDMIGVARDAGAEALIGAGTGAAMELGMAGLRSGRDMMRGAPDGTPRPGGDFTPEQIAEAERRMDAGDPDVFNAMTQRERVESAAAQRRVRSTADSAALTDVRRAGDYNGPGGEGYRGLARDLDEFGISPRGSITFADAAQRRAAQIENQSGRALGRVRQQMDDAARTLDVDERILSNADDELDDVIGAARREAPIASAAERQAERSLPPNPLADDATRAELDAIDASTTQEWRASLDPETRRTLDSLDPAFARGNTRANDQVGTGAARRGNRPQGVSMRDRADATIIDEPGQRPPSPTRSLEPGYEPVDPADARRAVTLRNDPARVRYDQAAERLRNEARALRQSAVTPAQRAQADSLDELARSLGAREPETMSEAVQVLRGLDSEAAYGRQYPNAPDAGPRVELARQGRRAVRAAMDEPVGTVLGPEALAEYQGQRGRFGAARATSVMGERGAEREAANLQMGLGDTIAAHGGLNRNPDAGPITRIANAVEGVIVQRYLRGGLHTAIAAGMERQSDAMASAIVRRLSEQPVTEPMARALAEAGRRGPRAFGEALVQVLRDRPEVAQDIEPIVRAVNEDGTPNWEIVPGVQFAGDEDETGGADIDWSVVPDVQFADEYDEEGRQR